MGQISVRIAPRRDLYRIRARYFDCSRSVARRPACDGDSDCRIRCNRRDGLPVSLLDGGRAHHNSSWNDVCTAPCSICRRSALYVRSGSVGQRGRLCHARPNCQRRSHGHRTEANLQLPMAVDPVAALGDTIGLTTTAHIALRHHPPAFL
jgi:hypothetical protein